MPLSNAPAAAPSINIPPRLFIAWTGEKIAPDTAATNPAIK